MKHQLTRKIGYGLSTFFTGSDMVLRFCELWEKSYSRVLQGLAML